MHRQFPCLIPASRLRIPQPPLSQLHSQLHHPDFQIRWQHLQLLYPQVGKAHRSRAYKNNIGPGDEHNVRKIDRLEYLRGWPRKIARLIKFLRAYFFIVILPLERKINARNLIYR